MGSGILPARACRGHSAGHGGASRSRSGAHLANLSKYILQLASDAPAGMFTAIRLLPIALLICCDRQGLERLVVTKSVIGKVAEQIVKVAIDRMKHPSPVVSLPALQLLLTCMYTEAADRLNQPEIEEPLPDVEPEALVRSIERTSAIFDKIRKGHAMEVEILCTVLSALLGDFFPPSEILTKVIGEFLSPQQPHPQLLSAVVFKVRNYSTDSFIDLKRF